MTSDPSPDDRQRPAALVAGASRRIDIGAAIVRALAADGWDVATTYWRPYDAAVSRPDEPDEVLAAATALGARTASIEADPSDAATPERVFDAVEADLGPVTAMVISHCDEWQSEMQSLTPLGRLGTPQDCANLVRFLCSDEGGWVDGQLLASNGGIG